VVNVGYCPTMASYAGWLKEEYGVKLLAYQSSAEALEAISKGEVEVVVIGRKARKKEIVSLEAGYFQPDDGAVTAVKQSGGGATDVVDILWRDVDYERVELVTPVYEDGRKVEIYRTPFVYYANETQRGVAEKFSNLIKSKIL
jgi:hypothetical protein